MIKVQCCLNRSIIYAICIRPDELDLEILAVHVIGLLLSFIQDYSSLYITWKRLCMNQALKDASNLRGLNLLNYINLLLTKMPWAIH